MKWASDQAVLEAVLDRSRLMYTSHADEDVVVIQSAQLRAEWRFDQQGGGLLAVRRFDGVPRRRTRAGR